LQKKQRDADIARQQLTSKEMKMHDLINNQAVQKDAVTSGSHTAWNRACPAYKNASERAKKAYTHRPRQFVIVSTMASIIESNKGRMFLFFITQLNSSDGYTIISRKKGRPLNCTVSIIWF
jgi:hypothetical protein